MNVESAVDLARRGRLYPAVILHGADQAERRARALELARTLLCARGVEERPCSECRHCRRVAWPGDGAPFHPDFSVLERDLRTVTSVGATKEFLRVAQVSPFEARGQVFVIADADTLSGEAANALLKTLEEPPESAPRHFILLAPSQLDLLPTLRSRSLALFLGTVPRPSRDELDESIRDFEAAVDAYDRDGSAAELLAAAGALLASGEWDDPRATEPWERAAAVAASASPREDGRRTALLALATDLLSGPLVRVRGIRAQRILEGMVSRHLG